MSCRVRRDIGKSRLSKKLENSEPNLSQKEMRRRIADGEAEKNARKARIMASEAARVTPIKKGERAQGAVLVSPSRLIKDLGAKAGKIALAAAARRQR